MVIGLLASLLHFIYITSRPHIAFLGRNPDLPGDYSDLERHPENIPVPGLLIVRFDAPLFYANAQTFSELVLEKVNKDHPKAVLLDAVVQDRLDVTSAEVLMGLVRELHSKDVAVYTAEVHGPVREFSQRTGLLDLIGEDRTFPTIDTAVRFIETSAEWVSNNK
jgi:SulP family sulfate permease